MSQFEKEKVLEIATSKDFVDDSPWIIVAKLADQGRYVASESSFYKILKERKLLVHRGKSKPLTRYRPEPLIASQPNQIWTWDITYLKTNVRGQYFYLYLFLDIFSRKIVGFDVHDEENMVLSSGLIKNICQNEGILKDSLVLHSDNGGPMKGATMLATLEKLGIASSFSRPRVSNDNPYSESLFKTLKYSHRYPEIFDSIDEARAWTKEFVHWYNHKHLHSSLKFVTPSLRHEGKDIEILANRKMIYEKAKKLKPERWNSRETRNWQRDEKIYLNCLQKKRELAISRAS